MQNAILLALVLLLAVAVAVTTVVTERTNAAIRRDLAAIQARLAESLPSPKVGVG